MRTRYSETMLRRRWMRHTPMDTFATAFEWSSPSRRARRSCVPMVGTSTRERDSISERYSPTRVQRRRRADKGPSLRNRYLMISQTGYTQHGKPGIPGRVSSSMIRKFDPNLGRVGSHGLLLWDQNLRKSEYMQTDLEKSNLWKNLVSLRHTIFGSWMTGGTG